MNHNFENLSKHIISLSTESHWELARREWMLDHVEVMTDFDEDRRPETCPCGHYPITELCWLENSTNGNRTFVGNICVRKFMDIPADTIANGFKRILADAEKALNIEATEFARGKEWINSWERDFCISTVRKRKPSGLQLETRMKINQKVLQRLRDQGRNMRS